MTTSETRPPWLYKEQELEKFVDHNNLSLNLSDLRRSRNNCHLVNDVLDQMVSRRGADLPGEWEMNVARIYLAVDLQNILKKWCCIGLEKTLEGPVRHLFSSEIFSSELGSAFRKPVDLGTTTGVTKVEASSPSSVFPAFCPKDRFRDQSETWDSYHPYTNSRGAPASTRIDVSSGNSRPPKRSLEDADQYQETTKMARTDKSTFFCPFYIQNSSTHVECAQKTFPNPRKLKEHVWRFLKPFKCPTCGEGFGREKTKVIHCDQRKTKCTKAPSNYKGSPDYRRDRQIEGAKSTREMIEIFKKYEKEKELSQSHGPNSTILENSLGDLADERSSSPDSQNGSTNDSLDNTSDNELDPRTDEYAQASNELDSILPGTDNHYTSQQEANFVDVQETSREAAGFSEGLRLRDSDRCNRHRGRSLNPPTWNNDGVESYGYTELTRTQSAPPFHSASSTYSPIPEIVVTLPDLELHDQSINAIGHSTYNQETDYGNDSISYPNPTDGRGNEYLDVSMEGLVTGPSGSSIGACGPAPNNSYASGPITSNGYGGFGPFSFRMNIDERLDGLS